MHLYGSTRLGMVTQRSATDSLNIALSGGFGTAKELTFTRAEKIFELSNHLGNVLVTVSDRRLSVNDGEGVIAYYEADVVTANDYYPFGMGMVGRKYVADGAYRYGFNGKENDNEARGAGNQISFEARIYDPRLGRFYSIDPVSRKYPWQTPYSYHRNNPVNEVDHNGEGDPPVEPTRKQTTVQKGGSLWSIAKKEISANASNQQIADKLKEIADINSLDVSAMLEIGQVIFTESESSFNKRVAEYKEDLKKYERTEFENFPAAFKNPINRYQPRPRQNFDKNWNFFRTVRSLSALLDASVSGADVAVIEGSARIKLKESIHEFGVPDDVDFYQSMASRLRESKENYIYVQTQVRFGPIDRIKAYSRTSTYLMRNA